MNKHPKLISFTLGEIGTLFNLLTKEYILKISSVPIHWLRYFDEILCIWPCDQNENKFLNKINDQVPSIRFTVETENEKCLLLLDLTIHRDDFSLKCSVYRKPTNNLSYVHYFSEHSSNVKKSIFSSMYLRALLGVNPEFLDIKFNKIKLIGKHCCSMAKITYNRTGNE